MADQPRANKVRVSAHELIAELTDGRIIHVPLDWFPRLRDATAAQRRRFELIGKGIAIHWPDLDEDFSIRGLLLPEAKPLGAKAHIARATVRSDAASDDDDTLSDEDMAPMSEDRIH